MRKMSRGFTLIELLVVITIIAILAAIAFPVFSTVQERARATQDLNNLRQLGIGLQTYLNDNDGIFFPAGTIWMASVHPKYLPAWKIFQSPFDKRTAAESDTTAPVSYGLNQNLQTSPPTAVDKIVRPTALVLIAPAQSRGTSVAFTGTPATSVTVKKDSSFPGGTPTGGTHAHRTRINALFADLHVGTLSWTDFLLDQNAGDPNSDANFRWDPAGHP